VTGITQSMRVVSYNICDGGLGRVELIAAVLSAQQPDVVALLEADDRTTATILGSLLNMALVYGEANDGASVAWLSRLPVQRAENHRLPALSKTLLELEVVTGDRAVRLFATHLASRHDEPTHSRLEEVDTLLTVLRSSTTMPHVLLGDLNSIHPTDSVGTPPTGVVKRGEALEGAARPVIQRLVDAGYVDCYRLQHPASPGYTYPTEAPWLRLDYIFASQLFATQLRERAVVQSQLASLASDHFPLAAVFDADSLSSRTVQAPLLPTNSPHGRNEESVFIHL
jgi:exodeoxyribonuclease III